jgi:type II secretory pathway component PulK
MMRLSNSAVARAKQRGVALAIVVWFIAGMSLLVAGIVSHARVDTRMAQLHVARAKAAAAGDGAIQLMMADVVTGKIDASGGQGLPGGVYRMGELEVVVTLAPTAGLINLNRASAEILAALFIIAAQLDPAQAQTLADNVIKWRSTGAGSPGSTSRNSRFTATEDLLRVDGVGRTLLDAVRDYVFAGMPSSKGENWALAPGAVLAVIRKMDPQKADAVLQRRSRLAERSTERGEGAGGGLSLGGGSYRADAVVHYGDRAWLRRRWVSKGSKASSLVPWRIVRTEGPRVVNAGVTDG